MFTKETSKIWPRPRYYIPQIVLFSIGLIYLFCFSNSVTDALQPVIQTTLQISSREAENIASLISLTIQLILYGGVLICFILDHADRKRRLATRPQHVCPKCEHHLDPFANRDDQPSNVIIIPRTFTADPDKEETLPSQPSPTPSHPHLRCPECGHISKLNT